MEKLEKNPEVSWIYPPSGMFNYRSSVDRAFLKLARQEHFIGGALGNIYREAKKWRGLPKGWTQESVEKFWDSLTGDAKHKVTKCMKEMEGKVTDTGAFCAALCDKVEGTDWRKEAAVGAGRKRLAYGHGVHVEVRELPRPIQRVLKEVGYNRRDIRVEPSTTYTMSSMSGAGQKGFTAAVNLGTGQYQIEWGSWGGPNMFNPRNQIDLDDKPRPIPPNNAIIQGVVGGGRPTYASIEVHPDNLTKLLGTGNDIQLTEDQKKALNVIGGIKGGLSARRVFPKGTWRI